MRTFFYLYLYFLSSNTFEWILYVQLLVPVTSNIIITPHVKAELYVLIDIFVPDFSHLLSC